MYAEFDPASLHKALQTASTLTNKENQHALIECGEKLSLCCRRDATFLEVFVEGRVIVPGTIAIPVAKMKEIAKGKGMVSVETTPDGFDVKQGRKKFHFNAHAEPIPRKNFDVSLPKLVVAGSDLKTLIDRTSHICEESLQYASGGCLIESTDNELFFTSLTSRGMLRQSSCLHEASEDIGDQLAKRPVVPKEILATAKSLVVGDEPVSLSFTGNEVCFGFPNAMLCGSLLAMRFLDVNRVLGNIADCQEPVEVGCEEFRESFHNAMIIAANDTKAVKIAVRGGEMELSHGSQQGNSVVVCECKSKGEWTIALDGIICQSVAGKMEQGSEFWFSITKSGSHAVLKSSGFIAAVPRITI